MRRELVLLAEMIQAAEETQALVAGIDVRALEVDRQRRVALRWNFTVLGEAAAQLDDAVKARFSSVESARASQLRNRIVHGYWSIDVSEDGPSHARPHSLIASARIWCSRLQGVPASRFFEARCTILGAPDFTVGTTTTLNVSRGAPS